MIGSQYRSCSNNDRFRSISCTQLSLQSTPSLTASWISTMRQSTSTTLKALRCSRGLHKRNNTLIVPLTDEGQIDLNGVEAAIKPARRAATNWTTPMVQFAHERKIAGDHDNLISLKVFAEFEVEVTKESVTKTLRQEINTEHAIDADLRKQAAALTPAKGKRGANKKYSDEFKAEVVQWMRDNNATGVAAGEHFGIHNSLCNTWRREVDGYQKERKVKTA